MRLDLRQSPMGHSFLSRERVMWTNPTTGQEELRYGVGTPIPLLEALRQRIISVSELSEDIKAQLREHAISNPEVKTVLANLRDEQNRAIPMAGGENR